MSALDRPFSKKIQRMSNMITEKPQYIRSLFLNLLPKKDNNLIELVKIELPNSTKLSFPLYWLILLSDLRILFLHYQTFFVITVMIL